MSSVKKRERQYRAHYIDARIDGETPQWVRIGQDNEDLSRSVNYNTEEILNVLGETEVSSTRQSDSLDVNPYYIRKDEPLGKLLEKIDMEHLQLDDIKRDYVEVILDSTTEPGGTATAFMQTVDIKPTAVGGPANNGDMIAFTLSFSGDKVKGTWDLASKTFTKN